MGVGAYPHFTKAQYTSDLFASSLQSPILTFGGAISSLTVLGSALKPSNLPKNVALKSVFQKDQITVDFMGSSILIESVAFFDVQTPHSIILSGNINIFLTNLSLYFSKICQIKIHITYLKFTVQKYQKSWKTFLGYFKNKFHAYIPYS